MIGGNIEATIQVETSSKNAFGEPVSEWNDFITLKGYLDFVGGDGSFKSNFKGKLLETTHIFICDYQEAVMMVKPTQCKMIINNENYEMLMIDNPMSLNEHLEIMLKYNEAVQNEHSV